jgi:phenylalanyl-tRNA synthetase beta chain
MSLERKSRNERHFAAAWCGKTSGFEMIHGLLDRIMLMLKSAFITREEGLKGTDLNGYWIEEADGGSTSDTNRREREIIDSNCFCFSFQT